MHLKRQTAVSALLTVRLQDQTLTNAFATTTGFSDETQQTGKSLAAQQFTELLFGDAVGRPVVDAAGTLHRIELRAGPL